MSCSASRRVAVAFLIGLLTLSSSVSAQAPAKAAPAKSADVDALVARVLKTFDVPGIALAIVKDGRVVVAKGYGVRKLGEPTPVDERTLFGIASNSKVFTATALGLLVEEGKIEWDAPVIKYLPWFQMYDPYVTRELTVRDLLVHRSGLGLGAGDLLWWPQSTYNRKEVAQRLQFIKPATSFRSAYAYDNVLYLVAGEVIEAVSGQSWEDFVTDRIMKKVGMADSKPRHSDANGAAQGANIATPHAPIDGKVQPIKPFDSDNTNPAGGINSSAADIAKWMLVRLADGKLPDGSRLYSDRTSRTLTTLVTPTPINTPPPELAALRPNFAGYALGLGVTDYRGHKLISHTGGLPGYVSRIAVIPDVQLGVAVLTNQESGGAFNALTMQIIDQYLNAQDAKPSTVDWIDAFAKVTARQNAETEATDKRAAAARDASSKPSLPLEKYAGTYTDAWYGDVNIAMEGGKLVMRFSHTPALVGDLEHWQHDTFVARWRDRELRADAYVIVALDADGSIDQIKMRAASPSTDFSFDFQDLLLRPARR
jgi:CubicO group peptidase (beta-lactamase class C family)